MPFITFLLANEGWNAQILFLPMTSRRGPTLWSDLIMTQKGRLKQMIFVNSRLLNFAFHRLPLADVPLWKSMDYDYFMWIFCCLCQFCVFNWSTMSYPKWSGKQKINYRNQNTDPGDPGTSAGYSLLSFNNK